MIVFVEIHQTAVIRVFRSQALHATVGRPPGRQWKCASELSPPRLMGGLPHRGSALPPSIVLSIHWLLLAVSSSYGTISFVVLQ
jgi:hypothetical protein